MLTCACGLFDSVRSKSIWGRVRGPTRKDTGASVNRPSPAPARPSPRPPRPPHASAGNRTDTGSSVGRGRATSDGTASHTPTLGPVETRGWLVLKEGYLNKTKWTSSRVVSVKSTKLRYFFLKQNPDTLVARLEYVNTTLKRYHFPFTTVLFQVL